nr:uncharacterized protein LOC116430854 [Nomia melanderi]
MFTTRRRISDSASEALPSFVPWQKLLVAGLALGGTGLLMLPRYGPFQLVNTEVTNNTSVNSNISTQKNLMTVQTVIGLNSESTLGETMTSTYCHINACSSITCSYNSINFDYDAGERTSEFLETVFKDKCSNTKSIKLSLDNCIFRANALRKNWLRTDLSIEELNLNSCVLREIEDDAFALPIFKKTKKITLLNNKLLQSLHKAMFRHLISLEELAIRGNVIVQAEFDLLENVNNSLTNLDLSTAINDPLVLRNITGGSNLPKLLILGLQGNSIPTITNESFTGVTKVQSLYLQNSNIKTISQGTFNPMDSSIRQIILSNNVISSLPNGLFNSILRYQKRFRTALDNNPWNCECSLKWMQDLIKSHPNVLMNVPLCRTPAANAEKSFETAEFCQSDSTATHMSFVESSTEPTKTSTTSTDASTEMIAVNCSMTQFLHRKLFYSGGLRKLLATDLTFPFRSPDFFIQSKTDRSIRINLPNHSEGVTLLWFDSNDVKGSVSCVRRVRDSYQVRNIDPGTTYTICLLSDNEDTVSPLNCLAATTKEDKVLVIIILTSILALCFLAGVFFAIAMVWKHPSLLRGSKRVIMVKKNKADVIVLPKGMKVEEQRQTCGIRSRVNSKSEDDYITPLPPAPAPPPRIPRISRVSLQSDWHSYVSAVDLPGSQFASWSPTRQNSEQERQRYDAPPLPPYPLNEIPSLSLTVEGKEEDLESVVRLQRRSSI